MSGNPVKDSDINSSSESDQLLLQQFLESSNTDHLEKPGILNTFHILYQVQKFFQNTRKMKILISILCF